MASNELNQSELTKMETKENFHNKLNQCPQKTAHLSDFNVIKTLGSGGYGKVYYVRNKSKKTVHAMKVLRKGDIVDAKLVQSAVNERRILSAATCPFIIGLDHSFQDAARLYLVLEYAPGGDLAGLMNAVGEFQECESRFYAAQLAVALGYLHSVGVMYRDVKPENCLIDGSGYLKLSDFGLARLSCCSKRPATGRTGTPAYMAPEVVQGFLHTDAMDWWSLGVLLYEMNHVTQPFYCTPGEEEDASTHHIQPHHRRNTPTHPSKSPHAHTYDKIIKGEYTCPPHWSAQLTDLVTKLLQVSVVKRLGSSTRGAADVTAHPWFASVDWHRLERKQLDAPFVPKQDMRLLQPDTDLDLCGTGQDGGESDVYSDLFDDF